MHAIAHCIPRFDRAGPSAALASTDSKPHSSAAIADGAVGAHPHAPATEPESPIAAAEARGRAAGLAEAEAAFEALRARQEQERAALLETARSTWVRAEGVRLAEALTAAQQAASADLAGAVARALAPILEESLHRASVEAFTARVRELMASPDAMSLEISGPSDLLAAMRTALGAAGDSIRFLESDRAEARASVADSVVETRLAAWCDRLRAAIG